MNKFVGCMGVVVFLAVFGGCFAGGTGGAQTAVNQEQAALLKKYMPQAAADGTVKVAVVRNLSAGDHTKQFLEGCVSEGQALGFTVDTFITDGDGERCQAALAEVIGRDYDGLILSHGEGSYTYNALKPAVDKGMAVVTFDSAPYRNGDLDGELLKGVTSTVQDDAKLAYLSLQALVTSFEPGQRPLRVIRAWMGPGVPPLDRRQRTYDQYVRAGTIVELALVAPSDFADPRNGTQAALAALLPQYPEGTVDAIWGSYDELAKGCLDALDAAGRKDIKLISIDISNEDIRLMVSHGDVWVSTTAADPKLMGITDMRIAAAKLAGEFTPDTYSFDVQEIKTAVLNSSITMADIATVRYGWGAEKGVFDRYGWMADLKDAGLR
ncbi:MAG: substrate-binding domain-containing protein [Treponema sp.]|jgi:simple sugar transport system substrate-binding protein|nr:substrate-binding domain-containing protein [Treponema sp.]